MISNTRNDLISKTQFNFNAEHNGIPCIESLRPEDKGTENQFWWTVAGFSMAYDESERTIRNNIASLVQDEEVSEKNFRDAKILDSNGVPHTVTLYNLEVLNKLGMCCFRGNKKAKEIRNKFSDVLVKHETSSVVSLPQNYIEALEALLDSKKSEARMLQALEAEKEAHAKDNQDFCEGLKILEKKARQISTKREITAMKTASKKARECKALTLQNINYKNENNVLRDAVGRGQNWRTISAMTSEWQKLFGHAPSWQKLMNFSKALNDEAKMPIRDVHETIVLKNGTTKDSISYRYHIEAWDLYKKSEIL